MGLKCLFWNFNFSSKFKQLKMLNFKKIEKRFWLILSHFFCQKYSLFSTHCPLLSNFFLRLNSGRLHPRLDLSRDTLAGGEEEVTKEDNNRSVAAFTLVSRAASPTVSRCVHMATTFTSDKWKIDFQYFVSLSVIWLFSIVEGASHWLICSQGDRCNKSRSNLIWWKALTLAGKSKKYFWPTEILYFGPLLIFVLYIFS